jgi:hypothetical protein
LWAATSKKSQSKSSNAITDQFPGLSDLDGLKKELAPGPEANKRLAQDLAAFAVDGGQVLIGVAEGEPLTLWPVQLKGLPERVESVGMGRVDPGSPHGRPRVPRPEDA